MNLYILVYIHFHMYSASTLDLNVTGNLGRKIDLLSSDAKPENRGG